MPVSNLVPLRVYIDPKEKKELEALAKQTRVSVSELCRRLLAGKKIEDPKTQEEFLDLIKCCSDLARLGNLFKLALNNEEFEKNQYNSGQNTEDLINETRTAQSMLKTLIRENMNK